jgi:hypothetical protein
MARGNSAGRSGQNLFHMGQRIPLGFTPPAPLNPLQSWKFTRVTKKSVPLNSETILPRLISLEYLQGVQPGWNFSLVCLVGTNDRIGENRLIALNCGDGIPLGIHISSGGFSKAPSAQG